MISHRRRCIFVHIEKTGGCSIEHALFGVDMAFSNPEELIEIGERHRRLSWYREHFPNEYRRYFKFAFVRNPWARTLSWWTNMREGRSAKRGRAAPAPPDPADYEASLDYNRARKDYRGQMRQFERQQRKAQLRPHTTDRPFREFALDPFKGRNMEGKELAANQILESDGLDMQPELDFVGRFETLADDFRIVCGHLGVEVELPHFNRSTHAPYVTYYDDETREAVAKRSAIDIERFGYRFGG